MRYDNGAVDLRLALSIALAAFNLDASSALALAGATSKQP